MALLSGDVIVLNISGPNGLKRLLKTILANSDRNSNPQGVSEPPAPSQETPVKTSFLQKTFHVVKNSVQGLITHTNSTQEPELLTQECSLPSSETFSVEAETSTSALQPAKSRGNCKVQVQDSQLASETVVAYLYTKGVLSPTQVIHLWFCTRLSPILTPYTEQHIQQAYCILLIYPHLHSGRETRIKSPAWCCC